MGIVVKDLHERVQPIVQKWSRQGTGAFTTLDIICAALLMVEHLTTDEMYNLIQRARGIDPREAAREIVAAADKAARQRKRGPRQIKTK
jgi:hypothetical protein